MALKALVWHRIQNLVTHLKSESPKLSTLNYGNPASQKLRHPAVDGLLLGDAL